jgi:beta-mannosidase
MHQQPLPSSWQFRRLPDQPWDPALVPGSVHLDLLRLHQIPDPFFADHEKQVA